MQNPAIQNTAIVKWFLCRLVLLYFYHNQACCVYATLYNCIECPDTLYNFIECCRNDTVIHCYNLFGVCCENATVTTFTHCYNWLLTRIQKCVSLFLCYTPGGVCCVNATNHGFLSLSSCIFTTLLLWDCNESREMGAVKLYFYNMGRGILHTVTI